MTGALGARRSSPILSVRELAESLFSFCEARNPGGSVEPHEPVCRFVALSPKQLSRRLLDVMFRS